jgi:chitinase
MKIFTVLMLCIVWELPLWAQYQIVGYYPAWESSVLPPSQLPLSSLTDVIQAFAWPGTDGSVQTDDGVPDTVLTSIVHAANKKVLLSFGGADNPAGFDTVSVHPELRTKFISNLINFFQKYHYDGIDIDWEEPGTSAQRDSMVSLVRELRTAFDQVDSGYMITMAIPASDYYGQWYNFTALLPYINFFNTLTYDYNGSWSSHAGYNAPLYAPNDSADYSVNQSIIYFLSTRHIPADKLMLGIPFYGKLFTAANFLEPFTSEEDLTYAGVVNLVKTGGWVYHWDSGAYVPYYSNGLSVITFDDSASVTAKCVYAKSKQLGGVSIWELSQDVVSRSTPLFDAITSALNLTTYVESPLTGAPIAGFTLSDNYPNPFNPTTVIEYHLATNSQVMMNVYDVLGRRVSVLVNAFQTEGTHSVRFDASNLPSGVYFYSIRAGAYSSVKKMIVMK